MAYSSSTTSSANWNVVQSTNPRFVSLSSGIQASGAESHGHKGRRQGAADLLPGLAQAIHQRRSSPPPVSSLISPATGRAPHGPAPAPSAHHAPCPRSDCEQRVGRQSHVGIVGAHYQQVVGVVGHGGGHGPVPDAEALEQSPGPYCPVSWCRSKHRPSSARPAPRRPPAGRPLAVRATRLSPVGHACRRSPRMRARDRVTVGGVHGRGHGEGVRGDRAVLHVHGAQGTPSRVVRRAESPASQRGRFRPRPRPSMSTRSDLQVLRGRPRTRCRRTCRG